MKIYLILIIFVFLSFLNCEEEVENLNGLVTEETLKKSLIFLFPVLARKMSPYKLPDKDEFTDLYFEFKTLTPDIFKFNFDENGILNAELNVQINVNGTMDYYMKNLLTKIKFTFSLNNIIIQSKIKLNITKNSYPLYEIKPEFISEPIVTLASRINILEEYGDIEELKKNVKSKVLDPFSYKYMASYHKKVFELIIQYCEFLINNYP